MTLPDSHGGVSQSSHDSPQSAPCGPGGAIGRECCLEPAEEKLRCTAARAAAAGRPAKRVNVSAARRGVSCVADGRSPALAKLLAQPLSIAAMPVH